ncbi:MAG: hypothetical protein IT305_09610 [Chloroflexi bacterium]|nr:hypothetical protein [Chloroflexota bacterium]
MARALMLALTLVIVVLVVWVVWGEALVTRAQRERQADDAGLDEARREDRR